MVLKILQGKMKNKIGVIGLGYVGLPLAISFSKKYKTYGLDINKNRIDELNKFIDSTDEVSKTELKSALNSNLFISNNVSLIEDCNIYIVTVPTPIDKDTLPDLSLLKRATEMISKILKEGDIIIFESTVYPGATEEICIPILEKNSGFMLNRNFFVGYSPERINPGDKIHTFEKIDKLVSGSNQYALDVITNLYKNVIEAKVFPASSIKVAEAAKVIENTQRDINIAFINELAQIFDRIGVDTNEVLDAASTKWNFLKFKPGLVGGHCIGVDPYYLAHKAKELGYDPKIILSGRDTNEFIPQFIFEKINKRINIKGINSKNVLILGATFKENCPDVRNSKSHDLFKIFKKKGFNCSVYDPIADPKDIRKIYPKDVIKKINQIYDVVIIAVGHDNFINIDFNSFSNKKTIIFDVKSIFPISKGYLRL